MGRGGAGQRRSEVIRFTRHSRDQMALRGISEAEVREVIENYHTRYIDRKGNDIYVGHPAGRRIKVVVAKGTDPPLIITAAD